MATAVGIENPMIRTLNIAITVIGLEFGLEFGLDCSAR